MEIPALGKHLIVFAALMGVNSGAGREIRRFDLR
jgi:hypothetical protein